MATSKAKPKTKGKADDEEDQEDDGQDDKSTPSAREKAFRDMIARRRGKLSQITHSRMPMSANDGRMAIRTAWGSGNTPGLVPALASYPPR